ncbi:MAG: DUF488 family protein [Muribaculaceae bacterium]|nr:DUF488 family protein [Muribaculaceae bacterium]
MTQLKIKRAYDTNNDIDGYRIYIDRLWPQGLSHETFHYDLWEKQISPSTELREWFHADPTNRWEGFKEKYAAELKSNPAFGEFKKIVESHPVVTLLYSSRNEEHNNAVVVKEVLENQG